MSRIHFVTTAFIVLFLLAPSIFAQQPLHINAHHSCSYYGEQIDEQLFEFSSSSEANQQIQNILNIVGLKPNFTIKASNVPNAAAVIYGTERFILYSQSFISQINTQAGTDWAALSILAHEVGHHLNGHTLQNGGSRPSLELEADEFSGFVMRKMGASLTEAQAGMKVFSPEQGSSTHPGKRARLEAIAVGWKKADEQMGGGGSTGGVHPSPSPKPSPNPAPNPPRKTEPVVTYPDPTTQSYNYIAQISFNDAPQVTYYLTDTYDVIAIMGNQMEMVGKMTTSGLYDYPYMLYDYYYQYWYVAENGQVVDSYGSPAGFIQEL